MAALCLAALRVGAEPDGVPGLRHVAGRMVMVVWTPRGEAVHVMSMRKCNDKEQARYSKRFEEG